MSNHITPEATAGAFLGILTVLLLEIGTGLEALAQTEPITPSGLNTQVNLSVLPPLGKVQYDITGGTRPGGGANLFHSFGEFGVPTNNIANFLNETATPTTNILSRVTGGNPSNIFGTLETMNFGAANLYLINPAGVMFGPTAELNVGGSFAASTADYLKMTDGAKFYANPAQPTVLSIAPVAAFGFLNPTPASISLQGSQLSLAPGQSFSLIGGDIRVLGSQVSAPAGLIQLASVGSTGEVILGVPGLSLDPFNVSSFSHLGRTDLQLSALDTSGTPEAPVGGAIVIRSGQLVMDNAVLLSNTAALKGGPISIVAPDIQMNSGLIQTATLGPGAAGDLLIATGTLTLTGGALISTQSVPNPLLPGEGQGGNIQISAANSISISGQRPGQFQFLPNLASYLNTPGGLYSDTYSGGNGGTIFVETPQLSLQSGIVSSHTFGSGAAGDITLKLGSLTMRDGGQVATNSFGSGQAGVVRIAAAESIDIAGHFPGESGIGPLVTNNLPSGVYAGSFVAGSGDGIEISTPLLTMNDGHIDSNTAGSGMGGDIVLNVGKLVLNGGAGISTITFGNGSAGSLTVNATDSVTLSGQSDTAFSFGSHTFPAVRPSSLISTTEGSGTGGAISIQTGHLVQQDGAVIEALSNKLATGKAGDINVEVGSARLEEGSVIASIAFGAGAAGNVSVTAADSIELLGETPGPVTFGTITFPHLPTSIGSTTFGTGDSGQVTVSARTLIQRIGIIDAETFGSGNAGGVTVNVGHLELHDGAFIGASTSGDKTGGSVTVTATESILIDGFREAKFPAGNTELINPNSGIVTNSYGRGNAGVISVTTPVLAIGEDKGGGSVGASSADVGAAGEIVIDVGRLVLRNGGSILGVALSSGKGGNITVEASESVSMAGQHPGIFGAADVLFEHIQSNISTITLGSDKAGRITVSTPQLDLHDGASILAGTGSTGAAGDVTITTTNLNVSTGGQISSGSGVRVGDRFLSGTGPGGIVTVNSTGSALISDSGSGVLTSSVGAGAGGNIDFRAGSLQMSNGATISSSSTSTAPTAGNAGDITLVSATDLTLRNSEVTTSAKQASGGNIKLTAPHIIRLVDSRLTSSVLAGSDGGDITIDPQLVVIQNSQILANANTGAGGNINIAATGAVLVDPNSKIDASAGPAGISGSVNINSPIQVLSGTLVPLKLAYSQAGLSGDRCAADPTGQFSSFVQAGRDGVPQVPGALSPSPLWFLDNLQKPSLGSSLGTVTQEARLGLFGLTGADSSVVQFHSGCRS